MQLTFTSDGSRCCTYDLNWRFFIVARYNTNGSLDDTFGADGIVQTHFGVAVDHTHALALQPNGNIIVAGETATEFHFLDQVGSAYDFAIVRYINSSGASPISVPLFTPFGLLFLVVLMGYFGYKRSATSS